MEARYIRVHHQNHSYLLPQNDGCVLKETLLSVVPDATGIKFLLESGWACVECHDGKFHLPGGGITTEYTAIVPLPVPSVRRPEETTAFPVIPTTSTNADRCRNLRQNRAVQPSTSSAHSSAVDTTRHALGTPSSLASSITRIFGNPASACSGSTALTTSAFNPRRAAPYTASRSRGMRQAARQVAAPKAGRLQPKPIKVAFLKTFELPSSLCKNNVIAESIMDLAAGDNQDEILYRLVQILHSIPGYSEIQPTELQLLQCEKKQLSKPVVAVGYEWTGERVKCLIGQGRLYVQLTTDSINETCQSRRPGFESLNDGSNSDSDFELPSFIPRISRSGSSHHSETRSSASNYSNRGTVDSQRAGTSTSGIEDCTPGTSSENQDRPAEQNLNSSAVEFNFTEFMPMEFLDESSALQEALRRSVSNDSEEESECQTDLCVEEIPQEEIEGMLRAHADKVITGPQRTLHVCRTNIWKTCLPFFSKPSFSQRFGLLNLVFSSDEEEEDGADLGGPRREFFRLLLKAICQDSGTLTATPLGYIPRCSINGLTKGTFRLVGFMLATIIVQGGETPAVFSPSLVRYMLSGSLNVVAAEVEDIPEKTIRTSLQSVVLASNEEELTAAIEKCEWRFSIDGLPAVINLQNKGNFVQQTCLHYAIIMRQAAIDQLLSGLEYYQVLQLLRSKPALGCLLEFNNTAITAHAVTALLKPCYSVAGSMRRTKEEVVVTKFRSFLTDIEEGDLLETLTDEDLTPEEKKFIKDLSPSHVLAFTTGSGKVPAAGFDTRPRINFLHDDTKCHPMAQTCSCTLILPVNAVTTGDSRKFECFLISSLMNGCSFSTV